MRAYVIGFMGSDRKKAAEEFAAKYGCGNGEAAPQGEGRLQSEDFLQDKDTPQREISTQSEGSLEIIDLASCIEKEDGRSLLRLCMMMGEHELHNKEYEALKKLQERDDFVLICTDGVILDEMNVDIIKKGIVILADAPLEELWENAKKDRTLPYAFLQDPDETRKFAKFKELYNAREKVYKELGSAYSL